MAGADSDLGLSYVWCLSIVNPARPRQVGGGADNDGISTEKPQLCDGRFRWDKIHNCIVFFFLSVLSV